MIRVNVSAGGVNQELYKYLAHPCTIEEHIIRPLHQLEQFNYQQKAFTKSSEAPDIIQHVDVSLLASLGGVSLLKCGHSATSHYTETSIHRLVFYSL